jgi:chloramphenicol 3-O phosphotransferase
VRKLGPENHSIFPGTIIILNGASSAGKSSIVKALQTLLPEPALDAGLDRFLWMLPWRYLERPLWDQVLGLATEAGPPGHQLVRGMHRAIVALSLSGWHIVADHVLVERAWVDDCVALLADLPAYLVGVRCPLDVLVAREKARRERTPGQAAAQHEQVHAELVYDVEVDTSLLTAEQCARQIQARVADGTGPKALRHLRSGRVP